MSFIISIESFVFPVNETEVAASRRDGCTPHTLLRPTECLRATPNLLLPAEINYKKLTLTVFKRTKKKKIEEKQVFFLTFGPA